MTPDVSMLKFLEMFLQMLGNFLSPKNISCFVERGRIDPFEENSTGHFDTKIYSNISIKFALKSMF